MKKGIYLFLFCIAYRLLSAQATLADVAAFDRYVAQAVAQWEVPGLAIAVVQDGKVVFQKGYGVRKLGEAAPIDTRTIYGICSTTKAMTAAAMGILVDRGKLSWDDPVVKHLPEFRLSDPHVTRAVRVRDLLTHNIGLPNADYLWFGNDLGAAEILRRVEYLPLVYPLRGGYTYHNVMYFVAGEVIARVSGMSWGDFVKKELFEPIGMTNTYPTLKTSLAEKNRSVPHYRVKGKVVPITDMSVDEVAAAGSVWSNVEDLSKWMRFVLDSAKVGDRRLLQPKTYAEWLKPQTLVPQNDFYPTVALTKPTWTSYALGWFQQDYRGQAVVFHTGSMDGTIAIHGLLPSKKLGVFVLGNLDHAEVRHALMLKAFDHFGGLGAERDWSSELLKLYGGIADDAAKRRAAIEQQRVPNTQPNLALSAYAGKYTHPLYGTVSVQFNNGVLVVQETKTLQLTLEHWHYDTFKGTSSLFWDDPMQVQFALGADGKVERMRIRGGEWMKKEG